MSKFTHKAFCYHFQDKAVYLHMTLGHAPKSIQLNTKKNKAR